MVRNIFFVQKKYFLNKLTDRQLMQINPISSPISFETETKTDQANKKNCSLQPTAIEASTSRIMESILNKENANDYHGKWAHLVFSRVDVSLKDL
jgi:hypothetical protein